MLIMVTKFKYQSHISISLLSHKIVLRFHFCFVIGCAKYIFRLIAKYNWGLVQTITKNLESILTHVRVDDINPTCNQAISIM